MSYKFTKTTTTNKLITKIIMVIIGIYLYSMLVFIARLGFVHESRELVENESIQKYTCKKVTTFNSENHTKINIPLTISQLHKSEVSLLDAIKQTDMDAISTFAQERKEKFLMLLVNNPESALLLTRLSANEISSIKKYTDGCIEQNGIISGELHVIQSVSAENQQSEKERIYIKTDTGKEYTAHFVGQPHDQLTTIQSLNARGLIIDNHILIDARHELNNTGTSDEISQSGFSVVRTTAEFEPFLGDMKTLIVKVNFNNQNINDNPEFNTSINTMMEHIYQYYYENSYGNLRYTGLHNSTGRADVIINPFQLTLDVPITMDEIFFDHAEPMYDELLPLINNALLNQYGTGLEQYDNNTLIVLAPIIPPEEYKAGAYAWTEPQMHIVGGNNIALRQITIFEYIVDDYPTQPYPELTAANNNTLYKYYVPPHEIGHTLGHDHASFLKNCNILSNPLSQCEFDMEKEYGDRFDLMGAFGVHHFNAKHKLESGFINGNNVMEVVSSGTYILKPIEVKPESGQYTILKIPRLAGTEENVYIEFRQPIGYDRQIVRSATPSYCGYSNVYTGVLLHVDAPNYTFNKNYSILLQPDGIEAWNCCTSAMQTSESFIDPLTNTIITVNSINIVPENPADSTATVSVTFGSPIECSDGISPRECQGTGDSYTCFNNQLVDVDCRECGCDGDLLCSKNLNATYSCCLFRDEQGRCIACYNNQDCSDNNYCTTDICENPGLATSLCKHEPVANSCGNRVCGPSPDGCYTCGSCEEGSGCLDGQCSTANCSDQGGICVNRIIGCDNNPATSKYTVVTGLDYYCPLGGECCMPLNTDMQ